MGEGRAQPPDCGWLVAGDLARGPQVVTWIAEGDRGGADDLSFQKGCVAWVARLRSGLRGSLSLDAAYCGLLVPWRAR